jgi:hypothetical protein
VSRPWQWTETPPWQHTERLGRLTLTGTPPRWWEPAETHQLRARALRPDAPTWMPKAKPRDALLARFIEPNRSTP